MTLQNIATILNGTYFLISVKIGQGAFKSDSKNNNWKRLMVELIKIWITFYLLSILV